MNFAFTEEEQLVRDAVEKFCKEELNRDYVKWMDENVDFPPEELWQKFTDMGIFRGNFP